MTEQTVFLPSLNQLRAFSEVARLGGISRASAELRRSQSAVTQAIQKLEAELSATLFTRTSSGSYLTDAGIILKKRTDNCFSRIEAALRTLWNDRTQAEERITAVARRITKSHILVLNAVHELGSFPLAARQVNMSLTSVYRTAHSLEKQLGRKLFTKAAQGIATNKFGALLSSEFHLSIRELEWAEQEIRSLQGALQGRLLIGSLVLAGSHYTSMGLERFIEKHPQVSARLVNGSYDELLSRLRRGSIDFLIGLLKLVPNDEIVEEAIKADPYVVVAAKGHELTKAKSVSVKAMRASDWVAPARNAQRRQVFEKIFDGGPLPHSHVETHSLVTIYVMMSNGRRLSLMTKSEMEMFNGFGNQLEAINYAVKHPPAVLGVTVRRRWEPTHLQSIFLDFLKSFGSELSVSGRLDTDQRPSAP